MEPNRAAIERSIGLYKDIRNLYAYLEEEALLHSDEDNPHLIIDHMTAPETIRRWGNLAKLIVEHAPEIIVLEHRSDLRKLGRLVNSYKWYLYHWSDKQVPCIDFGEEQIKYKPVILSQVEKLGIDVDAIVGAM